MRRLLLLLVLLGCAEERPILDVALTAVPRTVRSLSAQAALHGQPPWPAQAFSGGLTGFVVRLPRGARGPLVLTVAGLDHSGCEVARGTAQVQLAGDLRHEVALALRTLPAGERGCRVVVDKTGAGTVTSRPEGLACGKDDSRCEATFAHGTAVELIADRAGDAAFAGWSGACGGIGTCRLQAGAGTTSVGAAFEARTLCRSGWCWENPSPQGNLLRAVWARSGDEAWAVGDAGTILRWTGTFWHGVESGTGAALHGVWDRFAVGERGTILRRDGAAWRVVGSGVMVPLHGTWDGWAVGAGGVILRWDGAAWRRIESGTMDTLLAVWGHGREAWAAGEGGTVLRWDGDRWRRVATGPTRRLRAGWGPFVVGEGGTVLRWNGTAFTALPGPPADLLSVWGDDDANVWISGPGGAAYRVAGERLIPVQTNAEGDLLALSGSGPADLWAVGQGGTLLRWNGAYFTPSSRGVQDGVVAMFFAGGTRFGAWTRRGWLFLDQGGRLLSYRISVPVPLHNILVLGGRSFFAAGEGAVLSHTLDDTTWQILPGDAAGALYSIWGVDPAGDLWAVGAGGAILRGRGGGPFALVNPRVTTSSLHAVYGLAADDLWAAGDQGTILRWDGAAWRAVASPTTARLRALWGPRPSEIWAVGDQGTILRWDGRAWAAVPSGTAAGLRGIHGSSRMPDVWIVGEAGTVLHYDGTGFTRVHAGTGNDLNEVRLIGSDVWVAGEQGTILRHRRAPAR